LCVQHRGVLTNLFLFKVDEGRRRYNSGYLRGKFEDRDVIVGVGEDGGKGRDRTIVKREVVQVGRDELRIDEERRQPAMVTQLLHQEV
jgi:hypothetical protein